MNEPEDNPTLSIFDRLTNAADRAAQTPDALTTVIGLRGSGFRKKLNDL
jgi:hypothetical protein